VETLAARTQVSLGRYTVSSLLLRLFVWVGYLLLLSSLGCLIAFVVMAHLEGVSDWHFCSWNAAALGTIWVCSYFYNLKFFVFLANRQCDAADLSFQTLPKRVP